tara:strand:+ start:153 stop:368 length:216 start_codon:yes stop_codon:yes gene_type:complete
MEMLEMLASTLYISSILTMPMDPNMSLKKMRSSWMSLDERTNAYKTVATVATNHFWFILISILLFVFTSIK